ncbi:MAG: 5-oxoprolinase subunit PxpB [Saprospiraceae bacterium]|nr:5-oxoprolinase subunit PxpB [Saprospiraceae bacterium]
MNFPTVSILNECAVELVFGRVIELEIHDKVMYWTRRLNEEPFEGMLDILPAFASVTVFFDPFQVKSGRSQPTPSGAVAAHLEALLATWDGSCEAVNYNNKVIEIPIRYHGIDLPDVLNFLNMDIETFVKTHSTPAYRVFMIGFLPGFPYLGVLPEVLEMPRMQTPRLDVPAGSVAIAGRQTGIYPHVSPGGWHVIGTTELTLFDANQTPPALLQPGDCVRFIPV